MHKEQNDLYAEPLRETARANLDLLADLLGRPADLIAETYGPEDNAGLAFISGLTNQSDLKTHLLQPLIALLSRAGFVHCPSWQPCSRGRIRSGTRTWGRRSTRS